MNTPTARVSLPGATDTVRAMFVSASAAPPASMVPQHSDRATGVPPATPIPALTHAVKLSTAPSTTRALPIAARGDDALMSQPQ